jgi:hypothetical protein
MVTGVGFQLRVGGTIITPGSVSSRPPREAPSADVRRASRWRLRPVDRLALGIWLATRAVLLVVSLIYRYATSTGSSSSWLGLWQHWDWYRYLTVAEYGYTSGKGPAYDTNITAFFPGFPLVLRAVHAVVRNWAAAGLLVSLVAGGVAVVALARLAQFEWNARHPEEDPESGRKAAGAAVMLLVCAPAAVFLAVGYTESLFLAFAVPGWLAARQRHWVSAGILVALACAVRVNGLFLAAAVLVMFLLSRPQRRDWSRSPALLLPLAAAGGYMAYLKDITGDWLAWLHAEQRGWSRTFTNPITSLRTSWQNAFGSGVRSPFGGGGFRGRAGQAGGGFGGTARPGGTGQPGGTGRPGGFGGFGGAAGGPPGTGGQGSAGLGSAGPGGAGPGGGGGRGLAGVGNFDQWAFKLELLAAAVGLALVVWLAWRRRWAELVYVGLSVFGLLTSTAYMSIPREMLLWWPLWIGLALWMARRTWAKVAYVAVSGSLMVGVALLFFSGQWAG